MTDTPIQTPATETTAPQSPVNHSTTIIMTNQEKSVIAAFLLAFFFGPLGLLYATIGGGIVMIIVAFIVGIVTFGFGALITWPIAVIWAVIAAMRSKAKPTVAT